LFIKISHYENGCDMSLCNKEGEGLYSVGSIDVFECKKVLLNAIENDIDKEIKNQMMQLRKLKDHIK